LSAIRKLFRALRVAFIFAYSIVEVIIQRPRTRAERAAWLRRIGLRLVRSQQITFEIFGPVPMHGAVISNHLSFVDILLHAAMRPCVFVSKIELRSTPVFGWVSKMAGTVYVARGAGGSAAKAAEGMGKGFDDGLPVVFFPEGTTGVGDEPVMPMRSGLLSQAIALGQPITPGFIHYDLTPRDLALGKSTHNDVHWGPQSLLPFLWNFLGLHGLHATVRFAAEPIPFTAAAVANRKVAAEEARAAVAALSQPIQQPTSASTEALPA
jgi:1-acyl-sn-glycerol-3-phosphate acyltransferase